jgi:hypothetical protein
MLGMFENMNEIVSENNYDQFDDWVVQNKGPKLIVNDYTFNNI